jgi:hypothetical protein
MAKTSTLSMSVQIVGDGVNEGFNIMASSPVVNPAAPGGGPLLYPLILGANIIPVPPGTISMILIPPANSLVGLTLKGLTGDTGFVLQGNLPAMLPLPLGTLDVLIAATAPENVSILWL